MKIKAGLKAISVGKYQTTLYTKHGTTYYGSALGGIVTITIFITMATMIIPDIISVLTVKHYNLDISDTKLNNYKRDDNYALYQNSTRCRPEEGCKDILVRDMNDLHFELYLTILTNENCSDLTLRLYFVDFGE